MTSQINPNNIDGNYPVAGVPNNTQGFRDNFTNTKTNFQYAADEINELQSKGVFKAALDGTVLDNNMNYNILSNLQIKNNSFTEVTLAQTSGSINLDFSAGMFQAIPASSGSVSLSFSNWPSDGQVGVLRFAFVCTNTAHTLTLPASVRVGVEGLQGVSPGTAGVSNTITFSQTAPYVNVYIYEFTTADGGTQISVQELTRPRDVFDSPVNILNTTASTSKTTGALTVAGGTGISGNLNVGGNLSTYTSTGNVSFQVLDTGFLQIKTPTVAANTAGAFSIQGSTTYQPLTNTGCMIHITGNDGASSRIVNDAFGTGAIPTFTARAARGTAAAPTAIQSGDVLARFGFVGWDGTDFGAPGGAGCAIEAVATENFTDSAQGTNIKLFTSATGSNAKTLSMTVSSTVATFPGNVAAGNILVSGGSGVILTDGGTMGYGAGAGGTGSQSGNKTDTVVINKPSGQITMQNTALGGGGIVNFTLTNSTIAATDVLVINHVSGGTVGAYTFTASCGAGSATIYVRNATAGSLSEALVLRFAVIKGSTT